MIEFISKWTEQIVLAVVIATILELLLPNNKSQKYIKMIIGVYILFCIISPFIKDSKAFSLDDIDFSDYYSKEQIEVNQESMDKRLQDLYLEELEKDIIKTVEANGYKVINCEVKAILDTNNPNAGINKIILDVKKGDNNIISNIDNVEIDVNIESKEISDVEKNQIQSEKNNEVKIKNEKNNGEQAKENYSKNDLMEINELKKILSNNYEINEDKIIITII